MDFIYPIFYACLRLRFQDVEINPVPRRLFLLSAEYSAVMIGARKGTLVT